MAESESGGGSWWSSLITAAKEKSVSALSATKRDLAEFVAVVGNDTTDVMKHAGKNIKGLIQNENSDDESEGTRSPPSHPTLSTSSLGVPYDRSQAQLYSLQSSADTFLTDPLGVETEYQQWAKHFDVQSRQSEISQLLVNCPHVRTVHGHLVPAKVSYESFWQRYFFKLGLLQQEEQRRADLMARVNPQQEDLQWEELEEGDGEEGGQRGELEEGDREEGGQRGELKEGNGEEVGQRGERDEERKDGGERNKERQSREIAEDDLTEGGSSIIEIKSEHLRSESSDSFVCVSEDLPPSERSHASPEENEAGEWEYLKMAEVGEGESDVAKGERGREGGGQEGFDFGGDGVTGEGEGGEGGGGEKQKEGDTTLKMKMEDEKEASESSDWESWDD